MNDTIAILGAAGFVGHRLISALQAQGHKIIALMRHTQRMPDGVQAHIADFNTPEDFTRVLSHTRLIIHAAAGSTPGSTAGKPLAELDANLRPTLALLEALQQIPHCQLLYLSSGGALYGDTPHHPTQEDTPPHPRSYYGASKAAAEHFIHAAAEQFDLAATLLRPSNLFGPGQSLRQGFGIIPTAFSHAQSGAPLPIWGDGSNVRDYLYLDDFIRLCTQLAARPMPSGVRTFNVASGHSVSLSELIQIIRRVTGTDLLVQYHLNRSVDIARIELDTTQIRQHIGWAPLIGLEEGLRLSWQWWRAQTQ